MAKNKLDILVFGASGFSGKFVLHHLIKFGKHMDWGIAGRNEDRLKNALIEIGYAEVNALPIIIADVNDKDAIKKMVARTRVLINCCGPFDLYGEVILKSCIDAGTHYVDITAESQFMNKMLKYGDFAEKKGVYIISACGYDCIPSDLGISFVENNFPGTINSVETYMQLYCNEINGKPQHSLGRANFGTWVSAVNYLESVFKALLLKRNLNEVKKPVYTPKLNMKLLTRYNDHWACYFPTADLDVVCRSQQFLHDNSNKRPIQINNYIEIPSVRVLIVCIILFPLVIVLSQFKFGRYLLLKYPKFFTYGTMSHLESDYKMNPTQFCTTFKCLGWSNKLKGNENLMPPNKEIIACVRGKDVYEFTGLAVTLCALIILEETMKLPSRGGIYTPAVAFSKTSLVQQLQDNGVVFEILSIKDASL